MPNITSLLRKLLRKEKPVVMLTAAVAQQISSAKGKVPFEVDYSELGEVGRKILIAAKRGKHHCQLDYWLNPPSYGNPKDHDYEYSETFIALKRLGFHVDESLLFKNSFFSDKTFEYTNISWGW